MCDEQLLLDYVIHFLGYGSLNSPVWLVGAEAGGGGTPGEALKRASVWADRGRWPTEDLQRYHKDLKLPSKYDWSRKIQPTWGPLIRVLLALDKKTPDRDEITPDRDDVMRFQRDELGRIDGQNCVLDLSQLSSPTMRDWNFSECGISWLRTRDEYERRILPLRCDLLIERLTDCSPPPRLVLIYGLGSRHERWWERIAKGQFVPSRLPQLSLRRSENTLFALMPHPNGVRPSGRGARNKAFASLGAFLREELR